MVSVHSAAQQWHTVDIRNCRSHYWRNVWFANCCRRWSGDWGHVHGWRRSRRITTVTSFHHQPEAQHPKSSAIHKLPADYPIYWHFADERLDALNGRYRTNNGQTGVSALAR